MSKKRDKGKLKTRKELKAEYDEYMDKQKKKREYYKRRRACFGCFLIGQAAWYEVNDGEFAGTEGGGLWNTIGWGPLMGINNLPAILKAVTLSNKLGLDWFHVNYAIAWAMECYEKGIISKKDTDGLELEFGN